MQFGKMEKNCRKTTLYRPFRALQNFKFRTFSVDFNEDVTNVTAADFDLALFGVTANATVTVGNAGDADDSTYTVTVDTVAGDGTLGLDIAGANDIELKHVTATWEFLRPGHYVVAGVRAAEQPSRSHPILVDLLAPAANSSEKVEKMLTTLASSISSLTGVPIENVFINYREAKSGMVFDAGSVVRFQSERPESNRRDEGS